MCAAMRATDPQVCCFQEAPAYLQSSEARKVGGGTWADGIRRVVRRRLAGDYLHVLGHGHPHEHAVQRFARCDKTALVIGKAVSFGVGQRCFDVVQPVEAAIAVDDDGPRVRELASNRVA